MTHLSLVLSVFSLPWLADRFAELSRISSSALIAAIWQGVLLAGIAGLGLKFAPRIPAAARFAIWFAVFSLIAVLPFLHRSSPVAAATPSASAHAWFQLDSRWTLAITALWAAASLLRAASLITAALRVRALLRNAISLDFPSAQFTAANRRAQICSSADVDRPTVIGFFSPKILIPAWLMEKLTPVEVEHIVLHEAGHLNRADDWLNLLQKLALVLFPLNPVLAWVERRLCFERELACDERVLNMLAARDLSAAGYASSLTTLAEYRLERRSLVSNLALALGALGRESELGRRVARILRPATRMKPLHVRLATGAAIAGLLLAATQLKRTPQLVAFTAPEPAAQLASSATHADLLPGYRVVAARAVLASPQVQTQASDTTSHSAAITHSAPEIASPHAVEVRATHEQRSATPRMIAARQQESGDDIVVTRWTTTTWQSSDGYRFVRTSTIYSDAPAPQDIVQRDGGDADHPQPTRPRRARSQQISQPIAPYAAVPVPGGWLVFQL